jgi:large subunit ribosomal protein L13
MKTFMPKTPEIKRKWYLIDADGQTLGRLSSEVARILRGKNKPIYTPHVDTGDFVIIINAEKIALTGNKLDQKMHRYHSGYPGGLKEIKYRQFIERTPERVIEVAVKGMLPKNSLGRSMYTKLKVYKGADHKHEAQKPEKLELNI